MEAVAFGLTTVDLYIKQVYQPELIHAYSSSKIMRGSFEHAHEILFVLLVLANACTGTVKNSMQSVKHTNMQIAKFAKEY